MAEWNCRELNTLRWTWSREDLLLLDKFFDYYKVTWLLELVHHLLSGQPMSSFLSYICHHLTQPLRLKSFSVSLFSLGFFLLFNLSLLIFCHCFHIKCKHQKSWHKSHLRKYEYVANLNLWLIYCPLIVSHLKKYFKYHQYFYWSGAPVALKTWWGQLSKCQ